MAVLDCKDLVTWQKAMDLVEAVYTATGTFPAREMYGLTAQLRRAAVSIPSNIAEGQGRNSTKEFLQFLSVAFGSLREVETQVLIAIRLEFLGSEEARPLLELIEEVGRLINGLRKSLWQR